MTDIDNIKPINLILQQAQKVYELRMELPDGATIPLYGEIAKMGCLIHEYERMNGCIICGGKHGALGCGERED